jgi:hypothetical protein
MLLVEQAAACYAVDTVATLESPKSHDKTTSGLFIGRRLAYLRMCIA